MARISTNAQTNSRPLVRPGTGFEAVQLQLQNLFFLAFVQLFHLANLFVR